MMIPNQEIQCKRSFPRYRISDSNALMLMPWNIISYSLLDISKLGLSFCYYGEAIENQSLDKAILTLFTEVAGSSETSVQVISDTQLNLESLWHPFENENPRVPYLRRCGVKFLFSSEAQENVIDNYVESLKTFSVH